MWSFVFVNACLVSVAKMSEHAAVFVRQAIAHKKNTQMKSRLSVTASFYSLLLHMYVLGLSKLVPSETGLIHDEYDYLCPFHSKHLLQATKDDGEVRRTIHMNRFSSNTNTDKRHVLYIYSIRVETVRRHLFLHVKTFIQSDVTRL